MGGEVDQRPVVFLSLSLSLHQQTLPPSHIHLHSLKRITKINFEGCFYDFLHTEDLNGAYDNGNVNDRIHIDWIVFCSFTYAQLNVMHFTSVRQFFFLSSLSFARLFAMKDTRSSTSLEYFMRIHLWIAFLTFVRHSHSRKYAHNHFLILLVSIQFYFILCTVIFVVVVFGKSHEHVFFYSIEYCINFPLIVISRRFFSVWLSKLLHFSSWKFIYHAPSSKVASSNNINHSFISQ